MIHLKTCTKKIQTIYLYKKKSFHFEGFAVHYNELTILFDLNLSVIRYYRIEITPPYLIYFWPVIIRLIRKKILC